MRKSTGKMRFFGGLPSTSLLNTSLKSHWRTSFGSRNVSCRTKIHSEFNVEREKSIVVLPSCIFPYPSFLPLPTAPINVIGLYPILLPSDLRQSLSHLYPGKVPTLTGGELNEGMKHLIEYLTKVHTLTSTASNPTLVSPATLSLHHFLTRCATMNNWSWLGTIKERWDYRRKPWESSKVSGSIRIFTHL